MVQAVWKTVWLSHHTVQRFHPSVRARDSGKHLSTHKLVPRGGNNPSALQLIDRCTKHGAAVQWVLLGSDKE